uniref:Pentacotripeptide-repeat region of PRORP domain-containing protein n=1 Tax=Glycine max TaxID=3847 RepID=K7M801_SOYBN
MSPLNKKSIASKITNLHHLRQLHAQLFLHSQHRHNHWVALLLTRCTCLLAPSNYACHFFRAATFPNPDTSFYPVLKKSAGKASRLLHAHLLKLGHCHDHRVRNAIMGIYAKYGCIELARKLFDEMPDRTTADWNVIISGCWKCGDEEEASRLFCMMGKNSETARMYFDKMPERSVVSWNAMLSGYSLSGAAQETLRLFNDMLSSGNEPDQTTWVTVLSSCSSLGEPCLAKSIVRKLDKLNFRSNYFFKTALLNMHTKCGNLEVAQKIFEQLGVYKNSVTWNAMISAYARVVDLSLARDLFNKIPERNTSLKAIKLFKEMISSKGSKPDEVTMVSVFSACGHLGRLGLGNWAVSILNENHIKLSISGYSSLIFMYLRCGSMEDARIIFPEMATRDLPMGMEPNRITYISVLTACSHAGLLEEGQVGKFEEAVKLIQSMPMEPHAGIYGSLLNATNIHKRVELGELAAAKLFKVEPHNSGNYMLLSNIYALAGRWKDVDKVRDKMRKQGVKKMTAMSWVEHNS